MALECALSKEKYDRIEKNSKYPVVFEVHWNWNRNHFFLDGPQFTAYPHEQECVLIDGCYFLVIDILENNKLRE